MLSADGITEFFPLTGERERERESRMEGMNFERSGAEGDPEN